MTPDSESLYEKIKEQKTMATRRDFMKMGGLATVAGMTPGLVSQALATTEEGLFKVPSTIETSFYSGETFEPFLNEAFEFTNKTIKRPVSLKLVDLQERTYQGHTAFGAKTKSTSLIFEGRKGQRIPQDLYRVDHKTLGSFSVLLVPITNEKNCYEVIFTEA